MKLAFEKIVLRFSFPAGTSRGVLKEKSSWILKVENNPFLMGECSVIPGLNMDYSSDADYENKIRWTCSTFNLLYPKLDLDQLIHFFCQELIDFPSILFGVESVLYRINQSRGKDVFDSAFARGESTMPINGLIWMGTIDEMKSRVQDKIEDGFSVLKFKIGALDFHKEYKLISEIRSEFGDGLEIRVDANGAFDSGNIEETLRKLGALNIHSIEQPIKPGNRNLMTELCLSSPIPIALDEELIGVNILKDKIQLMQTIKPQYIILKPSLHGGIKGSLEWISLAKKMNIGWWLTSALESAIGLEIIARLAGSLDPKIPQGLGTGGLFQNNFDSPLVMLNGTLKYKNVKA
ncbi:MAG: o-succinylbenzoate synthase [Crocinitomicaceae bacterium]|tara:strand:+ start:2569 stop:3615 length:1047 start_codon:yes stop_codon:yes gene_type:complete